MDIWQQIFEHNALRGACEHQRAFKEHCHSECVAFYDLWIDQCNPADPLRSSLRTHALYNFLFDQLQEAMIESELLDKEFANMAGPLGGANVSFGHLKRKRSGHSQEGLCACKQCLVADVLQNFFFMAPRGSH